MKTNSKWRCHRGVSALMLMLAVSAGALAQQQQGATTQYGELDYGARQYYPQGCAHNGNTAVCTFVFVQQAQTQPIHIGWGGELSGIQLVDDSHVPHNPSAAYFVDNYGARQMNMTVNRGDQGTMMVEFSQVDPQVATCTFTLGQQALANIPVSQGSGGGGLAAANGLVGTGAGPAAAAAPARAAPALTAPNTLSASNKSATQHLASAQPVNQPANQTANQAAGCNTPQTVNTAPCKLNAKMTNAQNQASNTAAAVAAPVATVKSIMNMFGAPAQQSQPAQQSSQH
jgi:hypothetical protein